MSRRIRDLINLNMLSRLSLRNLETPHGTLILSLSIFNVSPVVQSIDNQNTT